MAGPLFEIDPDIRRAWTPPSRVYTDSDIYAAAKERIFARSWQLVGTIDEVRVPGQTLPVTLLEGCLDEPLLLARDRQDGLRCLSNVCTHRGMMVCETGGVEAHLRCRYHGRRFALDGSFESMPEFEEAKGFPSKSDDLPRVALQQWGPLLFAAMVAHTSLLHAFLTTSLHRHRLHLMAFATLYAGFLISRHRAELRALWTPHRARLAVGLLVSALLVLALASWRTQIPAWPDSPAPVELRER